MQNQEFIDLLAGRRSQGPKMQTAPGPDETVLAAAARAARTAPCHGEDFPVRFVRIVSREKLARAFEACLPPDADGAAREKARGKAMKGETLVAVIGAKPSEADERSALEALLTAGGALTNFLNVLFAAGFAAKTVSGRALPAAEGLLDPERETLLAFILCGTPAGAPKPRKASAPILSAW